MRGFLLVLTVAALAATGCAASSSDSGSPVPLSAMLAEVEAARYADVAGRPGVAVRDEVAFEEMRVFLRQRYGAAGETRSVTVNGVVFDCLPTAVRVTSDAAGAPRADCRAGSVPVRRITLDDLVAFPTLADFLGKGPAGEGLPGPS